MGLQKVALNFMVERGGKLAKSLLCTKPQKITNIEGLKYTPLKTDAFNFRQLTKKDLVYRPTSDFDLTEKFNLATSEVKQSNNKLDSIVEQIFSGEKMPRENLSGIFEPKNKVKSLQIDFASMKSAHRYAKRRVLEALHTDEPYEHLVIIDKKTHKIYGEYKGDKHKVGAGFEWYNMPESASVIHGHPGSYKFGDGIISAPISYGDFELLNEFGNDIIAYNRKGEFSLLMRKPNYKKLDEKQVGMYKQIMMAYHYPELLEPLVRKLPKEFQGVTSWKQLKNKVDELKASGKYNEEFQTQCKRILGDYVKELQKLKPPKEFDLGIDEIKSIHKFWQDYADELGVVYKTNYSYL